MVLYCQKPKCYGRVECQKSSKSRDYYETLLNVSETLAHLISQFCNPPLPLLSPITTAVFLFTPSSSHPPLNHPYPTTMSLARLPLLRQSLTRPFSTTARTLLASSAPSRSSTNDREGGEALAHPADVVAGKSIDLVTERLSAGEITAETVSGAPSECCVDHRGVSLLLHIDKSKVSNRTSLSINQQQQHHLYTRRRHLLGLLTSITNHRRPSPPHGPHLPTHQVYHAIRKGKDKEVVPRLGRPPGCRPMGEPIDGLGQFSRLHAGHYYDLPLQGGCRCFRKSLEFLLDLVLTVGREAGLGLPDHPTQAGQDPTKELRCVRDHLTRRNILIPASNYVHVPGKLRIHHTK